MNSTAAAVSPIELEVERIRELTKNHQYAQALGDAQTLLEQVPENRDVLYLAALSLRHLNRIPEALTTLEQLQRFHPAFSRLYQERGHCYVVLRDAPKAIEGFLRAVNINPALPASWSMLEGLYRLTGDSRNAATAAQHVATLKRLPQEVTQATGLFSDGELTAAEHIIRPYLLKHGNQVEAMRLLAKIGIARDVLDHAELLLEAVLAIAPDYRAARQDYVLVLVERHKYQQAREQLEQLIKLEPENRQHRAMYATACAGLGEHERAVQLYRDLLREVPQAEDVHLSAAHSLKALGRRDEAVASYRAAATARPSFGDAYWSLANLKTYRFPDEEIAQMRAIEAAPETRLLDRYHVCFALGKAFEDRGEYAQSWRYYEQGNALKRSESRYRPEIIEGNTSRQIETCTRDFFAARAGGGCQSPDPIFIVGLPRSGSTLLEQILASHSAVEGTQELSDIQRIVLELQGQDPDLANLRYPGVLTELPREELQRLGEKFMRDTRVYRASAKACFIDKNPNNFRHIGLIHLILPNAKIIDARREPMGCCFSNLKQLFAKGQEFTYSVEDIARYYRTYLDLMTHWDRVLPGRVLRVWHEDVVEDLESNVRRMLEFCDLPFEPGCLTFYRNERSVRTPSAEQVRQPIFREGLDQWKHYEPWLGPLREGLGDALTRYRQ
jgi:tetratricopeptide (TPR) repeat protein